MFDITIGKLSTLWDFKNRSAVPPETDIAMARETVDYKQVSVDGDTVRSANPDASIDLGGIAKGYIADQIADFLKESGVKSAVIDLGGNVVVVGKKTGGAPWNVGVRYPFGSQGELLGVLETGEASIVTSGIYERQFEENGVIYHHILDPNTGMPVHSDIVSDTGISESSMIGDVTTTVALLVGSEKIKDLIDNIPGFIGALLVFENGGLIQLGNINFHEID
jgi:thiamine biosynthesis lipoprotein